MLLFPGPLEVSLSGKLTLKLAVLLLLVGSGALLSCRLAAHPNPTPGLLILATLVFYFEMRAVGLPGAGLVSLSWPAVLALGLQGQGALACLAWLAGLLLRQLWRGHPNASLRLLEGLTELMPGMLALALAEAVPAYGLLAASLAFVCLRLLSWDLLAQELPGPLAASQRNVQSRLVGLWPGLCAAGAALWLLPGAASALFWPILEMIRQAVARAVLLEEQVHRQDVVRQLERSRGNLEQATSQQKKLELELQRQVQEVRGLEAASMALLQVQTRQQAADELVRLCRKLAHCQSLAVFLHDGQELVPVSASTPHAERLQASSAAGLSEPVVQLAFSSGTVQSVAEDGQARIFAGEIYALAFPLGRLGVLYAGKSDELFQDSELRSLGQAASQGGLGLHIASHLQSLNESLQQQSLMTQQLQSWSSAVDWLLHQALQFLDQLERPVMVERLTQAIQSTFPHDSLEVCLEGVHQLAACQSVIEQRTPLLLEDIAGTRFQPHRPGQRSLLCVPISHPGLEQVGVIVLGAQQPGIFSRLHCDLLSLLGFLAAAAWKNSELYAQTRAAQAQLIQSGKMAAVGQLAAGVAHELNTPLASIALSLDMSKRLFSSNPEAAVGRIDKANEMVDKARQIVNTLLYYSRQATAGRRPTDLNRLISETLGLMEHPLALEGVQVEFTPGELPQVSVNQNEIQQVLFNLLLNARDAVKGLAPDRKRVRVSATAEKHQAILAVLDQGVGIGPEVMERIFDPFFTTKPVGEGTGLGLSISQQIVQAHQGQLICQSNPQGTQFQVWLPLVADGGDVAG